MWNHEIIQENMHFQHLVSLLTLICFVSAAKLYRFFGDNVYQTTSCLTYLSEYVSFCDTSETSDLRSCFCTNENALASMVGCWAAIGKMNDEAMDYYIKYCKEANISITVADMNNAYTKYIAEAVSLYDIDDFNRTQIVERPIKLNLTLALAYYEADWKFQSNLDRSFYYGLGSVGYWVVIFSMAAVTNWSLRICPCLRLTSNGPISKLWRKILTLPALLERKRNDYKECFGVFDFLVPSRLETLIVLGFIVLEFGFSCGQVRRVTRDPSFPDKCIAIFKYLVDRTGIIGTVLLPMVLVLSQRNCLLQWLTRWKHSTFITYHRWLSRIVVVLFFLHSIFWSAIFLMSKTYSKNMRELYIILGTVATICGGIICFQSLLCIRRKAYEAFYVIHIILAIGLIVGSWYHLVNLGYMQFIYIAIGIWTFDRVVRLGRILYFGFPKAEVTLVEHETLRVVVPKPKHWKAVPGGYIWIHFCHGWSFWQAHPFTFLQSTTNKNKIVLLCKIKKGVTNSVAERLILLPSRKLSCRVCVEGPYGGPCLVGRYSNVVYLAGGNGIPGMFAEAYHTAKKAIASKQKIKLIWVICDAKSVSWMFEELEALKNTKVQTTIFITKPGFRASKELHSMIAGVNSDSASSLDKDDNSKISDKRVHVYEYEDVIQQLRIFFPHISFKTGRPCISSLVQLEIDECSESAAFVACGHPVMVDDLRATVVESIYRTEKRIDFFDQLQVWA